MHSERRTRLRRRGATPRAASEQELGFWLEQVELDDVDELEAFVRETIDPVEAEPDDGDDEPPTR